jgi:hypothetical protein
MPNLNVEITEETLKAIRVACAESGETQAEFVTRLVEQGGEKSLSASERKARVVHAGVRKTPATGVVAEDSAGGEAPGSIVGSSPTPAIKSLTVQEVVRPPHNSKTCNVYRCTQCIAAGKKF